MDGEYKRILAAVDGSKEAKSALKKAVAIAMRNDGELVITHIIDLSKDYQTLGTLPAGYRYQEAEKLLNKYADYAKGQGLQKVRTLVKSGSPKKELTEVIPKEEQIDLIVIGATGLGALGRIFIGSVANNVVLYAQTDVLLTRLPRE